jgi:predicted DNA-binding transcriptional regulator AlpA
MQATQANQAEAPRKRPRAAPAITHNSAPVLPRTYTQAHVLSMLGVTVRTVQRWVIERDFPKTKELGPRTRVYLADQVDAWIARRLK